MDLGLLVQIGGASLTILGIFIAGFWRMWGLIKDARTETAQAASDAAALALSARQEVADHRLHVAEHYVSKQGLREVRDEIMGAIVSVNNNLGRISERMDRIADRPLAT